MSQPRPSIARRITLLFTLSASVVLLARFCCHTA